ncbi:MAG: class I SAM-dependent methyltransferase [Candidatus Woesearchaeota archaeon]
MNTRMTLTYFNRLKNVHKHIKKGKRLLNIACGFGDYNYYLRDCFEESYGVDISISEISLASRLNQKNTNIYFLKGDIRKIPFKKNFFDTVICIETLEHVRETQKALSELARVLAENGQVIITLPVKEFPFTYDPINAVLQMLRKKTVPIGAYGFGHKKLYSIKKIRALITKHFDIIEEKYLSHSLIGLIENYVPSIFARFIKMNYKNKGNNRESVVEIRDYTDYNFPNFLRAIYNLIIFIDETLFAWDGRCISYMVIAKKKRAST